MANLPDPDSDIDGGMPRWVKVFGTIVLIRGPSLALTMTPGARKFALTAPVTASVGWLGAVAGFLALAIAGLTSQDPQRVRAAYLAMDMIGWFVIVPLSLASLVTGVIQSLGTTWGLFRHYWVLFKLLMPAARDTECLHPGRRCEQGIHL